MPDIYTTIISHFKKSECRIHVHVHKGWDDVTYLAVSFTCTYSSCSLLRNMSLYEAITKQMLLRKPLQPQSTNSNTS